MSESFQSRAEVEKLARALRVEPARLASLEDCAPADLRVLRHQIADRLLDADRRHFARVAAAAKVVPAALGAKLAEHALGPLLAARAVALVDTERAMDIVRRLPPEFLADVAVELDPRHAQRVIVAIPPDRIAEAAAELDRRGEHLAMSAFVGYLGDDALAATLELLSADALLRVGFLLEAPERLDWIGGELPDERIAEMVALAAAEDRWHELLGIVAHLRAGRRRRFARVAEAANVTGQLNAAMGRSTSFGALSRGA